MMYPEFLETLFEDGRLSVAPPETLAEDELAAGDVVLARFEQLGRLEMPGEPPQFAPQAGRWAAVGFYRACQFAVYRDVEAASVAAALGQTYAGAMSPAVHYSVDLTMRYLPDLLRFAASAAEDDPLVAQLRRWACAWPLSSVGIAELDTVSIAGFSDDAGLLLLYADRVLAAADRSRMGDPLVQAAVSKALGKYPELGGPLGRQGNTTPAMELHHEHYNHEHCQPR